LSSSSLESSQMWENSKDDIFISENGQSRLLHKKVAFRHALGNILKALDPALVV
jgi:hypothetical protein